MTRDEGSAAVEFLVVGVLLLVPIAYLVLTLGRVQAATFAAESGAREASRVLATTADGETLAETSVVLALADQGFAVVIADGRGTPGRGPAWERAVHGDFAGPVLEDQITALQEAARNFPDALDLSRVGIRGWSFGGELASMALLHRPDVFRAGVVGAPVTDQHLYDTFYTERYMGLPREEPEAYRRSSPLFDAASLSRPMLLIHGLADDNVLVANTLKLSAALFEAGKWHELVLIPNATHMTRSNAVTENILRLQLDFLRRTVAG